MSPSISNKELDYINHLVDRGVIDRSDAMRAKLLYMRQGGDVYSLLKQAGTVDPYVLLGEKALYYGIDVFDINTMHYDISLPQWDMRDEYLRHGFVPLRNAGSIVHVGVVDYSPHMEKKLRDLYKNVRPYILDEADINFIVEKAFSKKILDAAKEDLIIARPEVSAKTTLSTWQSIAMFLAVTLLLAGLYLNPVLTTISLLSVICVLHLVMFVFRFAITWMGASRHTDRPVSDLEVKKIRNINLPVYSILVPVYREASVLPHLLKSIQRLDYPKNKLDVKVILEEDDLETQEAAIALDLPDYFELIVVPDSQPKTKPKACNYALKFVRGEYVTIYDAEDEPEADQLKKVIALFNKSDDDLVCIQARLNYFNDDENMLTRMFTLEYSQWFDYLLPGLFASGVPIPLGGTSNHFKVSVLRELGAWDPYNVTEDADLGIRLSASGYRCGVVNSTTYEEANARVKSWINQRSRWIKGYMQTYLVHMRNPVKTYRILGFKGFVGFQLFIGFPPFTLLVNPILWVLFIAYLTPLGGFVSTFYPFELWVLAAFNLTIANFCYIYFAIVGGLKRRQDHLLPYAVLAPFYWVLQSVAAAKAASQLLTNPHYWEKTEHGVSTMIRPAESI